ncbi:1-acyl-sn-glycerol-3-phosphate acyltransferase [Mariniblastus sp.]|nr:1-acyl-sn-glycerol-3-phosphate acyltransferase [Mariniblastus sp.]
MHSIFIEKPYQFVPPVKASWPQKVLSKLGFDQRALRRREGVVSCEIRNADRLSQSLAAGHGVMLTPNHPRLADPITVYSLIREVNCAFYSMASWHLFNQGPLARFSIRLSGAFSVNREGMDRTAIDFAINVLKTAERPLVIFPEGTTSRTNDRLMAFMDGPAFIARTAAKRRAKEELGSGKVVVHPIAIKYVFHGDLEARANHVLSLIEKRLSWSPQRDLPLIDRVVKVGSALLSIKELEYKCPVADGATLRQRQNNMVNHLMNPLEKEWLGRAQEGGIQMRVKNVRVKIFPDMITDTLSVSERKRRWEQLERTYLAQQVDCYPENYVTEHPSVDRIIETVEKFEEDFLGTYPLHGDLKAIINVGEAIEVPTRREKGSEGEPLMNQIRDSIEVMLEQMVDESKMYAP